MGKRRRITLQPGDEVIVNGYHVRAVGGQSFPDGLQVYRPEADFGATWRLLYAGLAGDVLCRTSINIGAAADLAASDGWADAIATAKAAIKENN